MRYFIFAIIATTFFLVSCKETKHNCTYKDLSLVQAIQECNGNECAYLHQVVSEGLYSECLDSLAVMKLVNEYVEKNAVDTPIGSIEIYNSKEGYDSGETLSQPSEYYSHLILGIEFPSKYHNDIIFQFYKSGYKGAKWQSNITQ